MFLKDVNKPALHTLITYPIILAVLLVNYILNYHFGWTEACLLIAGYYVSNITVGIGLHRLWSHNAYKVNKIIEFILMLLAAGTLQGPILSWVSNHHKHHTYTDKDQDPHSPLKFKNPVLGFFWAHVGWMLVGDSSYKSIDRITMAKLGKNSLLRWQLKYYWQIATFMNTVLPLFIGYCIGGSVHAAYAGFLFIGIGRALQQQATFCVNSLCHYIGSKQYYKGTAGDIWWMAIFLLGENWHNFHHAFPSDYRNGAQWYHVDVHKWIIFLMFRLGLASDLQVTPKVRIFARQEETNRYYIERRGAELYTLQDRVDQLRQRIIVRLGELENSSEVIKQQLKQRFVEAHDSLTKIAMQLTSSVRLTENSADKILSAIAMRIEKTEQIIYNLYQQVDKITITSR